jgi:hypothetical protein
MPNRPGEWIRRKPLNNGNFLFRFARQSSLPPASALSTGFPSCKKAWMKGCPEAFGARIFSFSLPKLHCLFTGYSEGPLLLLKKDHLWSDPTICAFPFRPIVLLRNPPFAQLRPECRRSRRLSRFHLLAGCLHIRLPRRHGPLPARGASSLWRVSAIECMIQLIAGPELKGGFRVS